jgi:hypothetical protein
MGRRMKKIKEEKIERMKEELT